ncbi:MAG: DUF4007 family protein [Bacteroidia bacterium]|nr:DUF4007 family protein [Bacteroidia bacterium]
MAAKTTNSRLPRSFHYTFIPERSYINALLKFVATGREGDYHEIGNLTGIPTGESTGKVPAIINYCLGMGLIVSIDKKGAIKKYELSPLGRIILLEDPYLNTDISQWLCHLNMCDIETGADVWYNVFWANYHSIGDSFSRESLEGVLKALYGNVKRSITGPLINMYKDDSSFKLCGALIEQNKQIMRKSAPITDEMIRAYAAWLINLIERNFPKQRQITISDLDEATGWQIIAKWSNRDIIELYELLEKKNLFQVDRHMNPWIISPLINSTEAYNGIYDDLI